MTESWTEDGATWNCSEDSDTSDSTDSDCVGVLWEMFGGSAPPYELAYTDTAIITSDQTGTVTFDVTTDVAAAIDAGLGEFSFLIKKTNEGENGRIEFASLETGNGPSLVLTFDGEAGDTGTDAGGDAGDAGDASDADTDTGSGGAQGQPCDTDADCSGGLCITEALAGAPDGFCSQLCDVLLQDCPAGAVCAPAPFGDVCLSECVDSGDCRAGYHCVAYPGSANICEPACTDDAQCTQVGNCNDDTGFCSSLVEECFDGVDNDGEQPGRLPRRRLRRRQRRKRLRRVLGSAERAGRPVRLLQPRPVRLRRHRRGDLRRRHVLSVRAVRQRHRRRRRLACRL